MNATAIKRKAKAQRNAALRGFADEVAAILTPLFSHDAAAGPALSTRPRGPGQPPKCVRITKCRGAASGWRGTFTVPGWLDNKHTLFAVYYAAHEALHCITGCSDSTSHMRRLEQSVGMLYGYEVVYEPDKNGKLSPYPRALVELGTGRVLCDGYGRTR